MKMKSVNGEPLKVYSRRRKGYSVGYTALKAQLIWFTSGVASGRCS